ncbi:hypothetical protein IJH46_00690 [Candidatus Saccharibacteria bacterium]|nr:hypothetical protein [Candidatus Saccharibacteria bacterium]
MLRKITSFLFGDESSTEETPKSDTTQMRKMLDLIVGYLPSDKEGGMKRGTATFSSYKDKRIFIRKFKNPDVYDVFLLKDPQLHVFSTDGHINDKGYSVFRRGSWETYVTNTLYPKAIQAKQDYEDRGRKKKEDREKAIEAKAAENISPVDDHDFFSS